MKSAVAVIEIQGKPDVVELKTGMLPSKKAPHILIPLIYIFARWNDESGLFLLGIPIEGEKTYQVYKELKNLDGSGGRIAVKNATLVKIK